MVNRLSARDAMFYFLDEAGSTSHLGTLMICEPHARTGEAGEGAPDSGPRTGHLGLEHAAILELVENRLQFVPHYRQLVKPVSLGLARPVWVDDPGFDINFHVRRAGLPRPGGYEQLYDLVGRIMSRPLDRKRPLWELYLIEGLSDGRLAVLTKTHRSLINGSDALELSEILLDRDAAPRAFTEDLWMPAAVPGDMELAIGAVADAFARPTEMIDAVVTGNGPVSDVRSMAQESIRAVGGFVQQMFNGAPPSPLNTSRTATRGFAAAAVPKSGCAAIAERYQCSVNDVELAIITGVLRRWMLSSETTLPGGDAIRVILPLSAREPDDAQTADASPSWFADDERGFVTDLPVAESNPAVRLAQVAGLANRYAAATRRQSGGVRPLFTELGVVPFADISARIFSSLGSRSYNVPIFMADQPISQRYLLGHDVRHCYLVPVLSSARALSISVVNYAEHVQFAFVGDRGVLVDLAAMTGYVVEAYEELRAAAQSPPVRR